MCSDLCCSSTLAPSLALLFQSLQSLWRRVWRATQAAMCFICRAAASCDHVCDCRPKFIGSFDNLVGRSLAPCVPQFLHMTPQAQMIELQIQQHHTVIRLIFTQQSFQQHGT